MNRNVLIVSIALVSVIAAGSIFIAMKENSSQKAVPAQETAVAPALPASADSDVKAEKIPEVKKADKPSVQSSSSPDDKKEAPDMMSVMKERMKDPAMREQMLKMGKIQIARTFAPLFNDLRLDDAKREEFNDIMADYTAKSMDSMFDDSSAASKKEEASRIKSELDEDLKSLLGADFPKYEEFKDSMQSRQTVDLLNQGLSSEEKLDPEVQKNLVKALTDENKLYIATNGELNKGDLSSEAFDALEKNMAELNKKYLERAASYLNEKQLKAFKETLDQQLSMLQMGRAFIQKKQ